jgi:hypothetical protein
MRGQRMSSAKPEQSAASLRRRLQGALESPSDLAPGIERSMVRAFWSRTPLAAHADARAIAGLPTSD